jgi:hypothetical protein
MKVFLKNTSFYVFGYLSPHLNQVKERNLAISLKAFQFCLSKIPNCQFLEKGKTKFAKMRNFGY